MPADPGPTLQRLLAEEPFVRLLARTLLADDSDEIVQRTWLHALRHGGDDVGQPRSWLARIARNVAANLRRERRRRERHERGAGSGSGPTGTVPSSAELMQREEQRRALVAAVDALPAALRAVLLLRYFDGLPPRAIAQRLGLPVATVWNQLRRALELLRERLDATHGGDRRAWALPLVPFAAGLPALPAPTPFMPPALQAASATSGAMTFAAGVIAMSMKTKLVASAGVLLAAAAAFALWRTNDGAPSGPPSGSRGSEPAVVATASLPAAPAGTEEATPERSEVVPLAAPAAAKTGSLVVHVRWGDDKAPATGITVVAATWAIDTRVDGARAVTDASGTVRFDGLVSQPRLGVKTDRFDFGKPTIVEIRAGETTDVELELPIGLKLTGIVVDAAQAPVAGALIEIAPLGMADVDPETVASSGADGRFRVRGAPTRVFVGARAGGHTATRLQYIHGKDGNPADVRLQLEAAGGIVDGVVVDEHGRPIAGAVVRVGRGEITGIVARGSSAPPLPAQVRSDAQGRFRAVGVPPGEQRVAARSPGRAPWQGTCEVTASLTTPLRIELAPGATVRGVVRSAAGGPVKADITVGEHGELGHHRVHAGSDGLFQVDGLPAGEVVLVAQNDEFGRAEHRVRTEAGQAVACEVRLSTGIELHGRVEDDAGKPVKTIVECMANNRPIATSDGILSSTPSIWAQHARTDADGRFTVRNCPEGRQLTLSVRTQGFEELRRSGVVPGGKPVSLQLRRALPPSARITGIVVGPDGKPLANVSIVPSRRGSNRSTGVEVTGPDGRFDSGTVVPGTWTLVVRASDHPTFRSETRELAADTVWDLGTIQLVAGGHAEVTVDGDRTDVWLRVVDAVQQTGASLQDRDGVLVSEPLPPGEHRLVVSGKGAAAQSIPFTVRAGESTDVAVKLQRGVRQAITIAPPVLDPMPPWIRVRVLRGSEVLNVTSIELRAGEPSTGEVCLSPGDYALAAMDGDRTLATATFTVGEQQGPPVQLTLR